MYLELFGWCKAEVKSPIPRFTQSGVPDPHTQRNVHGKSRRGDSLALVATSADEGRGGGRGGREGRRERGREGRRNEERAGAGAPADLSPESGKPPPGWDQKRTRGSREGGERDSGGRRGSRPPELQQRQPRGSACPRPGEPPTNSARRRSRLCPRRRCLRCRRLRLRLRRHREGPVSVPGWRPAGARQSRISGKLLLVTLF
ncbi:peptidyl-prolyl cis-trans isomerase-like 4 [Dromiciops gliroides]|uniref:peptidyl-prolyl cis-trans isomerase-like 4 n=1 Tax=Dromiciops gliroides TaxID=33562 RepID=UPI001CC6094C|nr:peptidyl-prolyl cis-trans isomerase-like 4 [Dromiciops gliroides]